MGPGPQDENTDEETTRRQQKERAVISTKAAYQGEDQRVRAPDEKTADPVNPRSSDWV